VSASEQLDDEAEAEMEDVGDAEPVDGGGGEEPDEVRLEDDETADIDLSGITEDVAEEEGDTTDESDESDGEREDTDAMPDAGTAFGDMYVDTLAVVLAAVVDEHGTDPDGMDAEEIGELARSPPFHLDTNVNRLAEEAVGADDIPPGKACAAMTALLVGMVVVKETDAATQLVDELGDLAGEGFDT
jgi:hypothetical protein